MPKNLLPNASFEMDFGTPLCTNWGDLQNELPLPLSLTGQHERRPPRISPPGPRPWPANWQIFSTGCRLRKSLCQPWKIWCRTI